MLRRPDSVSYPTPPQVMLKVVNYAAEDGLLLDALLLRNERCETSRVGLLAVHGLRGWAMSAGSGTLAQLLAASGYTALCINKRNSSSTYESSLFEDVVKDIGGGVNYLMDVGCSSVVVLGHSLGGTEVAYYQAKTSDPRVKALILSASPCDVKGRTYRFFSAVRPDDPRGAYLELLNMAERMVGEGRGDRILEVPIPLPTGVAYTPMSAETFLSYRSPKSDCSLLKWVGGVTVPILILSHEVPYMITSPEDAEEIRRAATSSQRVDSVLIKGSDHFYTGHEEETGQAVLEWLNKVGLPPKIE